MKKLLFLELNEFNRELLEKGSSVLGLKGIQKLLSLPKVDTITDDTYESDFLEPWAQWVSVHTGVPASLHQIKHLGDVPTLERKQLWEALSEVGVSSMVWGAMNASRKEAMHCKVFFPDPWTFSERAYPDEWSPLLELLRYASKNYLNHSLWKMMRPAKEVLSLFKKYGQIGAVVQETPKLLWSLCRFRKEHFPLICLLDYLSTNLFLKIRKREDPHFSLLFLNSLAHLQHHHWHDFDYRNNERLKMGLKYIDRCLLHLFDSLEKGDLFLVANALSQKNTHEEKPWILYRQKDHLSFLRAIGIENCKVEAHMTHDAHLFFPNVFQLQEAKKVLETVKVEGQRLFFIESYDQEQLKLFYRICFTDPLGLKASFEVDGKTGSFFQFFHAIVQRTGKHIPNGTLYGNFDLCAFFQKKTIYNHEIFQGIINLMQKDKRRT